MQIFERKKIFSYIKINNLNTLKRIFRFFPPLYPFYIKTIEQPLES